MVDSNWLFLYYNCVLTYFFSLRAFTKTSRAEVRTLGFIVRLYWGKGVWCQCSSSTMRLPGCCNEQLKTRPEAYDRHYSLHTRTSTLPMTRRCYISPITIRKRKHPVSVALLKRFAWRSAKTRRRVWFWMSQIPRSSERTRGSSNDRRINIPGQHDQTWWRSKKGHQEPLSQGYKCSQNAQLCMEVLAVEHQDQAKTIS